MTANSTSREQESSLTRPTIHSTYGPLTKSFSFDVRSADKEFSVLNATTFKTKVDSVWGVVKGRIIVDIGSGVHIVWRSNVHKKRHSTIRADGQLLNLNTANEMIDPTSCVRICRFNKFQITDCSLRASLTLSV